MVQVTDSILREMAQAVVRAADPQLGGRPTIPRRSPLPRTPHVEEHGPAARAVGLGGPQDPLWQA